MNLATSVSRSGIEHRSGVALPPTARTGPRWPSMVLPGLALAGAPMLLVEGLVFAFQEPTHDRAVMLLELLYVLGWVGSIVGLIRLHAAGPGLPGTIVLTVQLIGVSVATFWVLLVIAYPGIDPDALVYRVTDAAWPLSHVFMLAVGIAVSRAGRLPGWRRFAALACGLVVPLSLLAGFAAGDLAVRMVFALATAAAFACLGLSVRAAWQPSARS